MYTFKLVRVPGSKYHWVEGFGIHGPYRIPTGHVDDELALERAQVIHREQTLEGVRPLEIRDAYDAFVKHKEVTLKVSEAEMEHVQKILRVIEVFGVRYDCNRFDLEAMELYINKRRKVQIRRSKQFNTPVKYVTDATIGKELNKFFEMLRYMRAKKRYTGTEDDIKMLRKTATRALAPSPKRTRTLTDSQFVGLWNSLPDNRRDYFLCWTVCGSRYGEIYRITAEHLDREGRRLWLVGKKGSARYRERWVPLHPRLFDVLVARADATPEGPLFEDWDNTNANAMLARHCDKLRIPRVTCNDLRRTFITWHAKNGTTELEMKKMVGHSPTSRMVSDVYAQLTDEAVRVATDSFPDPAPEQVPALPSDSNVIRPSQFWPQKIVESRRPWLRLSKDELVELYEELGTLRKLAERFNVEPAQVTRRFKHFGIVPKMRFTLTKEQVEAAILEHGHSRAAAAALGVARATLRDAMRRYDIKERGVRRPHTGPRRKVNSSTVE